ncbi:MAG: FapA family protein [Thermodesulfobacteriota bacterium]|nr:FapA family protein [Thermodesulfobacteriota bacterium]
MKQNSDIFSMEQKEAMISEIETREKEPLPEEPLEVLILKQSMEAWIKIPKSRKDHITLFEIKNILKSNKIIHGIHKDEVLKALIDRKDSFFLAAKGTRLLDHDAGIKECLFKNGEKALTVKRGETLSRLNFKENSAIATYLKTRDIFGKIVQQPLSAIQKEPVFRCGKGARIARDNLKVFAGRRGIPHISIEEKLYVFPIINVLEDADLRFGQIESFSNINISGILTGAYTVQAGKIKAKEIRGAEVEAMEDIIVEIGITDAKIRTQGSVYARYLHNSTIEAFGDVIIEHEILDSKVIISGKCRSQKSKIIASEISAKKGLSALGVGSDVTESCVISAGREDHLLIEDARITRAVKQARKELTKLEKEEAKLNDTIKVFFKKMVNLKLFYDSVKNKKDKIKHKIDQKKSHSEENKYLQAMRLMDDLGKKIESTIKFLKKLNIQKRSAEKKQTTIKTKIANIVPGVEKTIMNLEMDRTAFFEYAEKNQNIPDMEIKGKIVQGTVLKGVYSSLTAQKDYQNVKIYEQKKKGTPGEFEIVINDIVI